MILFRTIGLVALLSVPSIAGAEVKKVTLSEMVLTPTSLAGVSSAFVAGRFGDPGAFAAHATMQAGSVFPPHTHPDARMSLVLEGTMYLGVGGTVDPAAERRFKAGSVAMTPAGVRHWMAARDGDVRVLEIGTGPTVTEWVE
ncbi:MAG: cupin domain-containing protein [Pseudomonadota bacterium]